MSADRTARLASISEAYARVTGRVIPIDRLDPEKEPTRSLYRRFARGAPAELVAKDLGANDGQWLALELGRKPAVREVLSPRDRPLLERRARAAGLRAVFLDEALVEDPHRGWLRRATEEERSGTTRIIGYIGAQLNVLDTLRGLDAFLIAQSPDPSVTRPAIVEMGRLLGYPACCVAAYADPDTPLDNREYAALALARSSRADPLLNTFGLGCFHYLAWYPCRLDCVASLDFARAIDAHLARTRPRAREAVYRALALPRLLLDDRQQVILEGEVAADGAASYTNAFGPYAFDKRADSANFDWAFEVDVVSRFLPAGRVERTASGVDLVCNGQRTLLESMRDAVLLPFAAHP